MVRSLVVALTLLLGSTLARAVVPTAPSNLTAAGIPPSHIALQWTDNSNNETTFKIERKTGSGGTYSQIAAAPSNVVTFEDSGLTAGTTYFYRVRASNSSGNSAYTNVASVTLSGDSTSPTPVGGLTATVASSSQINLSWTASTDNVGVAGYRISRCQANGGCINYTIIATVTTTSFSDTGLTTTGGTNFSYIVVAFDAAGNTSPPAFASATLAGDTTAPSTPSALTATVLSPTQINLSWTASTDNVGVTGYRVERCQGFSCTTFAQIATPTTTTFSDTALNPSTSYSYRLRAVDAAGNVSAYSNIATATTQAPPDTTAPIAPTGLSTVAAGTTQINLTWTASTDNVGVTGYRVERCQGAGCVAFAQIAAIAATTLSDTGLTAATTYSYRVLATDAAGNLSAYSSVASATTDGASLTVTSPALGAVVASDKVTVSGTFQGPNNSGIAVNGTVATIVGNTFVASNVPLQLGANTLTVSLTTPPTDQTTTQTLSITSTGPARMEVLASPTRGVAPLSVAFTINNRTGNAIQTVQADYSGTGSLAFVDPKTLSSSYTTSGIYQAAFVITDNTGASYQQTVLITVQDTTQIDHMLQTAWSEFTIALGAQSTTLALQYFNTAAQDKYRPVFSALQPNLPQIVASFSAPQPMSVSGEVGEYVVSRTINGVNQNFFIYFVRDADGVWRLDSM